ncbi:MAG TPA: aldehyde dehydrogenase family protein [Actinomycetota bacterium]
MAEKIGVRNPRTGEVDTWIEGPGPEELAPLANRLRAAQPAWAQDLGARVDALMGWRDAIAAQREAIVAALVHDTGRLIESELEVDAILRSIERWCAHAPTLLEEAAPRPSSIPIVSLRQGMVPYQLVGVISPWNFPMLLSLIDAIPALVAGCSVLIKPSEIAPRFIEPLMRSVEAVPALHAVLAYVPGAAATGRALIDSADAICFTGSVPTGRTVGARAAERFIPAFLELGGKDPALVLASADLDRATSAILWGGTANAGQSCLSIERVYVDERVFDEFAQTLASKARGVRLATPEPGDGELGPIIAADQIEVIGEHLSEAAAMGARALAGGSLEEIDGGTYCPASVLTEVDHSMKVMTEETFGPILPLMPFSGVDRAVELANDTIYGLSAAVFAGSVDEAVAVGSRIRAGGISVNDAALTALVYDGEKNAFGMSGLGGSRMGPAALRRFGRRQAFLVAESADPDPWWYPNLRA